MSFLEYRAQKGQAGRAQISYTAVWLGTNGTGEKVFHLYDKTEYRDPPMSMITVSQRSRQHLLSTARRRILHRPFAGLAMTEETRVAALAAELTALREELEALRRKSHLQNSDAADVALASARREHRHDRAMALERDRTATAEGRADRAESRHADPRDDHSPVTGR
jgi:hypothetical protein